MEAKYNEDVTSTFGITKRLFSFLHGVSIYSLVLPLPLGVHAKSFCPYLDEAPN
jgi:hypothetical protein